MPGKPPPPSVQAFVICREIYEAPRTKDLARSEPGSLNRAMEAARATTKPPLDGPCRQGSSPD
jgi:hypothetical protein